MKILVIKQTSLGDVLHSTGHVRAIRRKWPDSRVVLLTANGSLDIYRHNPWVDDIILVDRAAVKRRWKREPLWAVRHMADVMRQVRSHRFDIAFDLQGLAKSVVFLYGAHAAKKFVKGRWPGLRGFRDPARHAIDEMDGVLALAGIQGADTRMEFALSPADSAAVDGLLAEINPENRPLLLISPFSRWASKDWSLRSFVAAGSALADRYRVVLTGAPERAGEIDAALDAGNADGLLNLAGRQSLGQFAALVTRARILLTGDSFPMHVAGACATPVVALFGPTDESRVGPRGSPSRILRAPDCLRCDRANCPRRCLDRIAVDEVVTAVADLESQLPAR